MNNEQFKMIQELFAHQYAMSMAGFSALAGILIAGQKEALRGKPLSDDEKNGARREGAEIVARAYQASLAARAHSNLKQDTDPNMQ